MGVRRNTMKQTTIIAVVLGILVLISIIQAFQLFSMKAKITDSQLSLGGKKTSTPVVSAGQSSGTPDTSSLPQMVGGC